MKNQYLNQLNRPSSTVSMYENMSLIMYEGSEMRLHEDRSLDT